MSEDLYFSEHLQAMLRVIDTLFGHEVNGLLPGDVSRLAEVTPSQATRIVANLRHAGWVETVAATGRVRLGPKPLQGALRFMSGVERAQRQLDEIKQRFTRQ
jgi:DNA-binding IclR family transcriptional regulator